MVNNIPFELFISFIGIAIGLSVFGFIRQPQIPAMLAFGGMFIMFIAVVTDNVIMGQIPVKSVVVGSTTNYTFTLDLFAFTSMYKMIFALIGVTMMLASAIMTLRGGDTI